MNFLYTFVETFFIDYFIIFIFSLFNFKNRRLVVFLIITIGNLLVLIFFFYEMIAYLINYKIDTEALELYSLNPDMVDATIIETNTLDTKEAIIAAILSEKPVSISNYDYVDESDEDDSTEDEDNINPAFASLKDLL